MGDYVYALMRDGKEKGNVKNSMFKAAFIPSLSATAEIKNHFAEKNIYIFKNIL